MENRNQKILELVPEQLANVTGGTGSNECTCIFCGTTFTNPQDYQRHTSECEEFRAYRQSLHSFKP